MNDKIEMIEGPFCLERLKRGYLPFKVHSACPECGKEKSVDVTDHYISHPTLNGNEEVYFGCYHEEQDADGEWINAGCDEEWSVEVFLRFSVEVVKEESDGD